MWATLTCSGEDHVDWICGKNTRTFWAIAVCSQAEIVLKCCKYLPLNDRSAGVMGAQRSKVFKVESLHNRDSNTASTRLCHIASHFSYFIRRRGLCFEFTLFLFFGERKFHCNHTHQRLKKKKGVLVFFPVAICETGKFYLKAPHLGLYWRRVSRLNIMASVCCIMTPSANTCG